MSDLHLKVNQQYQSFHIPRTAPNLILAGDIGRLSDYGPYLEFLEIQCRQFSRVFLVLGNHEFYGLSRQTGLQRAKLLEQEPGLSGILVVLNRSSVALETYPGIILLGCMLQSRILPKARQIVNDRIQDFQRIENWTVDDHLAEHALDVDWLQMQIRRIRSAKNTSGHRIIVVSHHPPSLEQSSRPADLGKPWSSAFGTDMLGSDDPVFSDVQVWIFGHTHFCTFLGRAMLGSSATSGVTLYDRVPRRGFGLVTFGRRLTGDGERCLGKMIQSFRWRRSLRSRHSVVKSEWGRAAPSAYLLLHFQQCLYLPKNMKR